MKMDESHHRSLRLRGYDYSAAGGYYVTVVAFRRECLFGEVVAGVMRLNALGSIVMECWDEIPSHFPNAGIDAFVIMPDHVHGIVFIYDDNSPSVEATHASPLQKRNGPAPRSLGAIVGSFKSSVTRRAGRELNSANIWQRNYYEHIVRNQTEYERITGYILANPTNWNDDEENINTR